jgi:hypothetical protein
MVTKPSQVEVVVDGLSNPLRHPTTCGCRYGVCRVISLGRFFLASLPSLSLEEPLPLGPTCRLGKSPHVGWGWIHSALIQGQGNS